MMHRTDQEPFASHFFKVIIFSVPILLAFILNANSSSPNTDPKKKVSSHRNPQEFLMEIYKEIKELGGYEKDSFVKREFHMNLDHNEKNKEEHVVVLTQSVENWEKMTVQVTYFKPKGKNKNIKLAQNVMLTLCFIQGKNIVIQQCDYKEDKRGEIFQEILKGIRHKKELLKLVNDKK
jgi:hypothetical protein